MPKAGASLDLQDRFFRAQLALAGELSRPVSLHCVRAVDAVRRALEEASLQVPIILHSWQQSAESTKAFARIPGTLFSIAPRILGGVPKKIVPMVRNWAFAFLFHRDHAELKELSCIIP